MSYPTSGALSRRHFVFSGLAALGATSMLPQLALSEALSADPAAMAFDGPTLLAATASGVLRHDGAGWALMFSGAVSALATHPDRPGVIFAGGRDGRLHRSTDAGQNWTPTDAGLPGAAILALTLGARSPQILYAALEGDGLWRSEDDGASWEFVMDRPYLSGTEHDVLSLVSVAHETGMAGIWLYAGTAAGLTRVPDCFCRWQDVVAGDAMDALIAGKTPAKAASLPEEPLQTLVAAPGAPDQLYAALPSGIWRSTDAGVNWARVSNETATTLTVDPDDPQHVVAAVASRLRTSPDGGATWTPFPNSKES